MVWSWYDHGVITVWSWCNHGVITVWSRYDHGMIPACHLQSVLVCFPFHLILLLFHCTLHDSGYVFDILFLFQRRDFHVSCGQMALVWFSHHMLIPKVSSAVTAKRTPVVKVSKCQMLFTDSVFRHASVSSTYPGQSVRPYVRLSVCP